MRWPAGAPRDASLHSGAVATIDTVIDDLAVILTYADRQWRRSAGDWLLVGHSFGGNVAQEFSHRNPAAVRAIIPAVGHQPLQDAPDALALELNRFLRDVAGD